MMQTKYELLVLFNKMWFCLEFKYTLLYYLGTCKYSGMVFKYLVPKTENNGVFLCIAPSRLTIVVITVLDADQQFYEVNYKDSTFAVTKRTYFFAALFIIS